MRGQYIGIKERVINMKLSLCLHSPISFMFWSSLQDRNDLRLIGMHVESSSRYADSAITLLHNRQAIAAYLILLFYLFFGTPGKYRCMATTSC